MESSNITLKVALLGPRESGKTRIARQLQGNSVTDDDPYVPTAAVRIVEMDRQFTAWTRDGKRSNEVKCKVELWDCSGDSKYEDSWAAIVEGLHGMIVCFNPTRKEQANDVNVWCSWFCKAAQFTTQQAVIWAHGFLKRPHKPLRVPAGDKKVSVPILNVEYTPPEGEDPSDLSPVAQFDNFLGHLYGYHPDADLDAFV